MEHIAENQIQRSFTFHKILWFVVVPVLALLVVVIYGNIFSLKKQYPEFLQEVIYPDLKSLQAFSLIDHQNRVFGLDQLKGRWTFLVFGYTQCPDICPATLSQLASLNQLMNEKMEDGLAPKFLFVSVDPARDSVNVLNDYIRYFDDGFIAVTGSLQHIEAFEDQFSVFHQYDRPDSDGNYAVTHSAEIFLIDPAARIVAKFAPPISTQKVTRQFQDLVNYFPALNKQNNKT